MTKLTKKERDGLDDSEFAFSDKRKEPLENESHVRNAIARFNQVQGVSNAERDMAWKRIHASAKKFDFHISETSWHEIGLKHAPANKTHK